MDNKQITISIELAQAILNYLQEQPFKDVHQLIGALMEAGKEEPQEQPQEK